MHIPTRGHVLMKHCYVSIMSPEAVGTFNWNWKAIVCNRNGSFDILGNWGISSSKKTTWKFPCAGHWTERSMSCFWRSPQSSQFEASSIIQQQLSANCHRNAKRHISVVIRKCTISPSQILIRNKEMAEKTKLQYSELKSYKVMLGSLISTQSTVVWYFTQTYSHCMTAIQQDTHTYTHKPDPMPFVRHWMFAMRCTHGWLTDWLAGWLACVWITLKMVPEKASRRVSIEGATLTLHIVVIG